MFSSRLPAVLTFYDWDQVAILPLDNYEGFY